MIEAIKAIWALFETYLAISNFISGKLPHSKLTTNQFDEHLNNSFDEILEYTESYGLKRDEIAPSEKSVYIKHAHVKFGHKNGSFTKIIQGQAESFFLERFNIPKDNRFNKFIIDSYLLSRYYQDLFKFRISKEKLLNLFTKKITSLHYLTIPNWRNKNYKLLIKEVEEVKKIDTKLFEFYKYDKKKISQNSKVASLLQGVLSNGKISNKTIFKLAAAEKLILVYKYAEGFSDAYKEQTKTRNELKEELNKIKGRSIIGQKSKSKIENLELKIKELNENWITAPLGRSLEKHGFRKLFLRNDGIFFLPLSMVPDKYNGNHKSYLENEVVKDAEEYYESIKESEYLTENHSDLNFIMLSNIVQVDHLSVLQRNRSLEITTPHLSQMLITSYFLNSDDLTAEIYINDVVRNVDFLTRLSRTTKTSQYLTNNFEHFKSILWQDFRIDINKPVLLSNLTDQQVNEIVNKLILIDGNVQAHQLKKLLLKEVKFYSDLKTELDEFQNA